MRFAEAAFGLGDVVFDPTNYVENALTAVNTFDTVLNTAEIIKHHLTNLEALAEFPLMVNGALTLIAELEGLASYFETVRQTISFMDPAQSAAIYEALYPIGPDVPCDGPAVVAWQRAKRLQTWNAVGDAIGAQSRVGMIVNMTARVSGIVGQLLNILGNLQGHQVLSQLSAALSSQTMYLQLFHSTYYRAQSSDLADRMSRQASMECVMQDIGSDLPR